MNNFPELVAKARTTRRFVEADRIPEGVLTELVDMARLCPCGANQQPLRYRIVSSPEDCALVFPHTKWAGAIKDWDGPAEGERPTGYIVLLAKGTPATDTGIAGQTIQLGANAAGYACCMLGAIDRQAIHDALKLPEELKIQIIIALGRPAETVKIEDVPESGKLAYWRSEDQIHHVPKLGLEQVLV